MRGKIFYSCVQQLPLALVRKKQEHFLPVGPSHTLPTTPHTH